MGIQNNTVVSIHYTLKNDAGELIDTTDGDEPLNFLVGSGTIIPGLERELIGLNVGDQKSVVVQPEDAYGEIDPGLVQEIPAEMFTGIDKIEVGMEFQTQAPNGAEQYVVVTEVNEKTITVDGNPELAGQILHFDVKIDGIREATPEEIDHGHVH